MKAPTPAHTSLLTSRPRGWKRWLLRAPIIVYQLHLGWMLGQRFLLLRHVGRISGAVRQTVLEVVRHDPKTATYTVASAMGGRNTHWFQNVEKTPAVEITVGAKRRRALAAPLGGMRQNKRIATTHPGIREPGLNSIVSLSETDSTGRTTPSVGLPRTSLRLSFGPADQPETAAYALASADPSWLDTSARPESEVLVATRSAGRETTTVVPRPTALSIRRSAPCKVASRLASGRPKPVP